MWARVDVDEYGQPMAARRLAYLAGGHCIVSVDFQAAESKGHCLGGELVDMAPVAAGVNPSEAGQPAVRAGHDSGQVPVRPDAVQVERRHHDCQRDSGAAGAAQVGTERSSRRPRRGHQLAAPRVAVEVHDHAAARALVSSDRASSASRLTHVATPRRNVGRWNRSFGACMPSSGSENPSSTVSAPR